MSSNSKYLTIHHAQTHQPWTVPYSSAIDIAAKGDIPHILASHVVLHAAKSVGKLAAVFEALDHARDIGEDGKSETIRPEQLTTIVDMSADLLTAALRLANLYDFDLAISLITRVREKNGVSIEPWGDDK